MITFGFKSKFGGWTRMALAIALGTVMVIWPGSSLRFVVMILAACLVVSGLVSVVYGVASGDRKALPLMISNAIVDIALGVVIFCFPEAVSSILMWIFGFALVIIGVYQLIVLASAFALLPGLVFLTFLLPSLCIIGGIIVLLNPFGSAAMLTMVAGICILVYGLSELFSTIQMNRAQKAFRAKCEEAEKFESMLNNLDEDIVDAQDVDYEKVDEQEGE